MTRSTILKIASAVGGVVLLAAVIFGVAAISAPSNGQGGLPFIPVATPPESSVPALIPSFTPDASSSAESTPTTTTVATSPVQTRTDGGTGADGYRVTRTDGSGTGSAGTGSTGNGSNSSGNSGSNNGSNTTTTVVPDPVKPIKDQLPVAVTGYSMGSTQVYRTTAIVAVQPSPAGRVHASLVLLTVHDFGSSAKAKAFIDKSIAHLYAKNQQSVPVSGGKVYFGTQGSQFGEVAFYSGRYAYEITVTATDGDPLGLKDEAVKLVTAFRLP
jgi:hypothetical protein